MKVKETLTPQQKIQMFNGESVGIFPKLILPIDPYYQLSSDMCLGYYTYRSANKTVSSIYTDLVASELPNGTTADSLIGTAIRAKFIEKWVKSYNTLIEEYNPLKNYEISEKKTGANQDKTTYDITEKKDGDNINKVNYNSNTIDESKTQTEEIVRRTIDTDDNVYGFNSSNPVPTTKSVDVETDTTTASPEKNTMHKESFRGGDDTTNNTIDETLKKSGTDTKDYSIDETKVRDGRDKISAELIEAELDLRAKQIFFDIVYKDIDSILTLSIYI